MSWITFDLKTVTISKWGDSLKRSFAIGLRFQVASKANGYSSFSWTMVGNSDPTRGATIAIGVDRFASLGPGFAFVGTYPKRTPSKREKRKMSIELSEIAVGKRSCLPSIFES